MTNLEIKVHGCLCALLPTGRGAISFTKTARDLQISEEELDATLIDLEKNGIIIEYSRPGQDDVIIKILSA